MYRVEKRVANTDCWGVIANDIPTRDEAIARAEQVLGGASTGVAIARTDSPYHKREIILGD